jgi:hypothetical protein
MGLRYKYETMRPNKYIESESPISANNAFRHQNGLGPSFFPFYFSHCGMILILCCYNNRNQCS